MTANDTTLATALARIADALERLAPAEAAPPTLDGADAFVWEGDARALMPVARVAGQPLSLLVGIDRQVDALLANTRRFAEGFAANNALLWGARGMGKSSLVKAVHAEVNRDAGAALALIELHREEIATLPDLLRILRVSPRRALLFIDDLSFDAGDTTYKSLKGVLEGGIEGRPANVLFYATSNRRHLLAREMIENERATAIAPGEAVEEKVSLSDRFGLWLGFHACDQATYLAMVARYADAFALPVPRGELERRAVQWALERGSRSGRVAWQFIQHLAGETGTLLS